MPRPPCGSGSLDERDLPGRQGLMDRPGLLGQSGLPESQDRLGMPKLAPFPRHWNCLQRPPCPSFRKLQTKNLTSMLNVPLAQADAAFACTNRTDKPRPLRNRCRPPTAQGRTGYRLRESATSVLAAVQTTCSHKVSMLPTSAAQAEDAPSSKAGAVCKPRKLKARPARKYNRKSKQNKHEKRRWGRGSRGRGGAGAQVAGAGARGRGGAGGTSAGARDTGGRCASRATLAAVLEMRPSQKGSAAA